MKCTTLIFLKKKNYVKTRGLFLLKIAEQIKNKASISMKKIIDNVLASNAFVSNNQESFLGLFCPPLLICFRISMINIAKDNFQLGKSKFASLYSPIKL